MDMKTVRQLAELMSQYGLTEVEYAQDQAKVRLCRGSAAGVAPVSVPAAAMEAEPTESAPAENIVSPLVGTFYRAASPEAEPFVKEGMVVGPDTVVCVVEAMKVMNEIKAEKSGVITRVLLENGAPVEFGQPMFEIQTDK